MQGSELDIEADESEGSDDACVKSAANIPRPGTYVKSHTSLHDDATPQWRFDDHFMPSSIISYNSTSLPAVH